MKTCESCGLQLPRTEFGCHTTSPDGRHSRCNTCRGKAPTRTERERKGRVRLRVRDRCRQEMVEYLRAHPCVDCGEDDIVVLEFDHVRGVKVDNVPTMVSQGKWSWERILVEVAKCDVRCANCHARATYQRRDSWRVLLSTEAGANV